MRRIHASKLRRVLSTPFFNEGWALYSERVMRERGFFTDPIAELHHLEATIFRAARIVVDTSLHLGEMTVDEAIAIPAAAAGHGRADGAGGGRSVLRLADPGLVVSHGMPRDPAHPRALARGARAGRRRRLRTYSTAVLREFHDTLASSGSLPLGLAERVMLGRLSGSGRPRSPAVEVAATPGQDEPAVTVRGDIDHGRRAGACLGIDLRCTTQSPVPSHVHARYAPALVGVPTAPRSGGPSDDGCDVWAPWAPSQPSIARQVDCRIAASAGHRSTTASTPSSARSMPTWSLDPALAAVRGVPQLLPSVEVTRNASEPDRPTATKPSSSTATSVTPWRPMSVVRHVVPSLGHPRAARRRPHDRGRLGQLTSVRSSLTRRRRSAVMRPGRGRPGTTRWPADDLRSRWPSQRPAMPGPPSPPVGGDRSAAPEDARRLAGLGPVRCRPATATRPRPSWSDPEPESDETAVGSSHDAHDGPAAERVGHVTQVVPARGVSGDGVGRGDGSADGCGTDDGAGEVDGRGSADGDAVAVGVVPGVGDGSDDRRGPGSDGRPRSPGWAPAVWPGAGPRRSPPRTCRRPRAPRASPRRAASGMAPPCPATTCRRRIRPSRHRGGCGWLGHGRQAGSSRRARPRTVSAAGCRTRRGASAGRAAPRVSAGSRWTQRRAARQR